MDKNKQAIAYVKCIVGLVLIIAGGILGTKGVEKYNSSKEAEK
jgi:hypothetical protein